MKQIIKQYFGGFELLLTGVFFIIMPLVFTKKLLDPALYSRYLALSIWLLIAIIIISIKVYNSRFRFFFSKTDKIIFSALLLFVISNVVSSFNSINTAEAIYKMFKEFSLAAAFFTIYQMLRNYDWGKHFIIKAIILMAFVFIIIAISQVLKADFSKFTNATSDFGYYLRQAIIDVKSTLANWNLFASYLLLSLPFSIFGALFFKNIWRIISILTSLAALGFIGLMASKAGWAGTGLFFIISIMVSYIYLFFYYTADTGKKPALWIKLSLIISPVILILSITLLVTQSEIKIFRIISEKVNQVFNPDEALSHMYTLDNPSSAQTRVLVWANTIEMVREHPMLGVGPGQWRILYAEYGLDGFEHDIRNGTKHFQRPHNDFLWVLAETGVIGFLLFITVFVGVIIVAYKNVFRNKVLETKALNLLIFAVLVAFLYMLNVSFDRERVPHNLMLFALMALALLTVPEVGTDISYTGPNNKKLVAVVLFIITGLLLFNLRLAHQMYNGDAVALKIRTASAKKNYQVLLRLAQSLQGSYYTLDPFAAPIPYYAASALSSLGKMNDAKTEFIKAQQLHPYHLQVLNNLATSYNLTGDKDNAIAYYKKSLAISPRYKEALVNMAIMEYNANQFDSALMYIKKVPSTEKNPPQFEKACITIIRKRSTLIYNDCDAQKYQNWFQNENKVKATFVKFQNQNDTFENILLKEIGK